MASPLIELFWIALVPLSWVWAIVSRWREKSLGRAVPPKVPVISVGNVHSGGSGKTPVVLALANRFASTPRGVAILSRGYRSELSAKGSEVDLKHADGPRIFGDEPWMLASHSQARVFIGKHRKKVFEAYQLEQVASVVILDDGFQHVGLGRHIDLVVINTDKDPLQSYCLPAGELREPLGALARASSILLTGLGPDFGFAKEWQARVNALAPGKPVFFLIRKAEGFWRQGCEVAAPSSVAALCAIAGPQRFFNDLAVRTQVTIRKAYPDHHAFTQKEAALFEAEARRSGAAAVVTTEKDFAKLSPLFETLPTPLYAMRVGYDIPEAFFTYLAEELARCGFA